MSVSLTAAGRINKWRGIAVLLTQLPLILFFKTDELSFTVPYQMFVDMIERFNGSFLTTKSWVTVRKKIERSKKAWGETE
jgi:hypothetical protein